MTSAAIGSTSPKMPSAATFANAALRRVVDREGQQAEQQRAARTASTPRTIASAGSTTAACSGGWRRTASAGAPVGIVAAVIARAPGTGSRASRRARAPRAGARTRRGRRRGSSIASSRACSVWITIPARTESNVKSADRLELDEGRREAATAVGRTHEHMARPVVHGVADRVVTAGGGQTVRASAR